MKSSQKKESFISKFVRKFVPCVAPSNRTHVIDMDVDGAPRHGTADVVNGRPAPTGDISVAGEKQNEDTEHEQEKSAPLALDTSPSTIQANTTEVEVIVPSLLPISETEGVTSGAVQPPGSTGTDIFSPSPPPQMDLTHPAPGGTHPYAGDTSHTATDSELEGSLTDDEAHADPEEPELEEVEPMEEDEDTLIMNGGAGIPIGPVSSVRSCR